MSNEAWAEGIKQRTERVKAKGGMKKVFVCSPFRACYRAPNVSEHTRDDNTVLAIELCKAVIKEGHAPFAPHLFYPQMLNEDRAADREAGIACGIAWLGQSDELWIYAEKEEELTTGMKAEIRRSEHFALPPKLVWMPACWQGIEWLATGSPARAMIGLAVSNG